MRVLITGAKGFVGKNLVSRLSEGNEPQVRLVDHNATEEELANCLATADFIVHLAGVNRPSEEIDFRLGNADFTSKLCSILLTRRRRIPIVYSSSMQARLDNAYGRSKRAAEDVLLDYSKRAAAPVYLLRFPNIFGKWCRPHYNSAVATFCHQLTRGLPITVHDAGAPLHLMYVDDVVDRVVQLMRGSATPGFQELSPIYETTVGEVADILKSFVDSRRSLVIPRVGSGLTRALYSTFVSYLPVESFAYEVPRHGDSRGDFVEVLKTPDCGQFSYFTAKPGVTRGEHYHHSKTEKFLVVQGSARFGFRSLDTGETYSLVVRGGESRIVDTIPGWVHSVTNVGDEELVVMLWANELFDRERPDTLSARVHE